jgi:DNA-binding HxlR family transcriptional regulator
MDPGARRFGELRDEVDGVSDKMLAQTLRGLERDGLVSRTELGGRPAGVEYALTPLGRSLGEPLAALRAWAETHINDVEDARAHYDDRASLATNAGER